MKSIGMPPPRSFLPPIALVALLSPAMLACRSRAVEVTPPLPAGIRVSLVGARPSYVEGDPVLLGVRVLNDDDRPATVARVEFGLVLEPTVLRVGGGPAAHEMIWGCMPARPSMPALRLRPHEAVTHLWAVARTHILAGPGEYEVSVRYRTDPTVVEHVKGRRTELPATWSGEIQTPPLRFTLRAAESHQDREALALLRDRAGGLGNLEGGLEAARRYPGSVGAQYAFLESEMVDVNVLGEIEHLEAFLAAYPDSVFSTVAHVQLARRYFDAGDYVRARRALGEARREDPLTMDEAARLRRELLGR